MKEGIGKFAQQIQASNNICLAIYIAKQYIHIYVCARTCVLH